ncbi:D-alanyl-D-alanine carboxypeptidase/D-alanyl-D-alanine endopeptidase [Flavimaricola marinus]|uniref:D-alanyl-D-alanine carboxypeptidase DacC n=1 Tax=Flavimaricola marinus TaxID=1819565 RepID=A0A238L874_9RHOB|nr:D-alanyl-D-alanine carboxypeptidase/D-alanyl-D-alanine-endopeptidase [Flavimaricola marinus]SMY05897.1 D-alanyl-D-alanine carboxypeptidase DacC precursor [Flavimaricola marinus]
MKTYLTRRALLAGGFSSLGMAALADAPLTAIRPEARSVEAQIGTPPDRPDKRPRARPSSETIVADSGLAGTVAFVVADARTGAVLEEREADVPLPPASVTKAVTALYALDVLGADHRFDTRLLATGPIEDGILMGDLILAGGGDPTLTTDHLAELAIALRTAGISEVQGAFKVWGGALPYVNEIEPSQLDHLGYNPAVSGLNLNFNRVHFEWTRSGGAYQVAMDARTDLYRPDVTVARMRVADRSLPIYTYSDGGGIDDWTVARAALGDGGSRWLPVRYPSLYAGDVFTTFARSNGIVLTAPERIGLLPEAQELARHESEPLDQIITDMLRYSTNLTAEVIGLAASFARSASPQSLTQSAQIMREWVGAEFGADAFFSDHSGLADTTRVTARDMVRILSGARQSSALSTLLKDIAMTDSQGDLMRDAPVSVVAKTGTLNFVSTLAGYARAQEGRELVFAIFSADIDARDRAKAAGDEIPQGSRSYNSAAKRLQQRLLQRWGTVFPA